MKVMIEEAAMILKKKTEDQPGRRLPNPITRAEVRRKRRKIRLGQIIKLRHAIPMADDDNEVRYEVERCQVWAKYRHLIILKRPNGMWTSRTYVELCMADRGQVI